MGVRRLLKEAVRVSVPLRWWLFVLFVPISASSAMALLYRVLSGHVVDFDPSAFLKLVAPSMLVTFFLGPFGEEFGWRGYLLPRLVRKISVVPAVLVVGGIWAIWHWPLLYQGFVAAPRRARDDNRGYHLHERPDRNGLSAHREPLSGNALALEHQRRARDLGSSVSGPPGSRRSLVAVVCGCGEFVGRGAYDSGANGCRSREESVASRGGRAIVSPRH